MLKNIKASCDHKNHPGEIVITKFGLEGSGIYPLGPEIRKQLKVYEETKSLRNVVDYIVSETRVGL